MITRYSRATFKEKTQLQILLGLLDNLQVDPSIFNDTEPASDTIDVRIFEVQSNS